MRPTVWKPANPNHYKDVLEMRPTVWKPANPNLYKGVLEMRPIVRKHHQLQPL